MRKKRKVIRFRKKTVSGKIAIYLLLMVILLGSAGLAGLFGFKVTPQKQLSVATELRCCDSGNGPDCKPETGPNQTITYNGQPYGLLRSTVKFVEGNLHLQRTNVTVPDKDTPQQQDPVVVNSSQDHATAANDVLVNQACNRPNPLTEKKDLFFKKDPPDPGMFMTPEQSYPGGPGWTIQDVANYCTSILDDEIIFVCKKNCYQHACTISNSDPTIQCYGDSTTIYDTYFRLADQSSPGIPDFIKNCDANGIPQPTGPVAQHIVTPTGPQPSGKQSLQLKTFGFTAEANINPWLSPLCKPAIYLYPQQKENVTVKIAPQGNVTLTIPSYPTDGWNVEANPDGTVMSNGKIYPYLYYEAQIPDSKVNAQANSGFVVEGTNLDQFFKTTMPKLGLNQKETADFAGYWVKALPNNPYYKITIVPENLLSELAPLTINPQPDTTIRVTLYFTPLDKKINLPQPKLSTVGRKGFTVVEWGGMFKKDKNHPFTCLM